MLISIPIERIVVWNRLHKISKSKQPKHLSICQKILKSKLDYSFLS